MVSHFFSWLDLVIFNYAQNNIDSTTIRIIFFRTCAHCLTVSFFAFVYQTFDLPYTSLCARQKHNTWYFTTFRHVNSQTRPCFWLIRHINKLNRPFTLKIRNSFSNFGKIDVLPQIPLDASKEFSFPQRSCYS